jgi:hypothetical protein
MRSRLTCLTALALLIASAAACAPLPPEAIVAQKGARTALDSPDCIRAKEELRLPADSPVLGVARNGEGCAYPLRVMAVHRVVNDHLGGPEILVVYDPDSATVASYDPKVDGKGLQFDFYGYGAGVMLLADRASQSLWSVLTGECVSGPMVGKRLARIPTLSTTVSTWRDLYADSWILATPDLAPYPAVKSSGEPKPGAEARKSLRGAVGGRLPDDELVLGVADGGQAKAYALSDLRRTAGVVKHRFSKSRPLVVFFDPLSDAAYAYGARVDGRSLSFAPKVRRAGIGFVDSETGSTWDLLGRCVDGPMKGKSLEALDAVPTRWYAWSAAYPKASAPRIRIRK